jgi:hypothetical protein
MTIPISSTKKIYHGGNREKNTEETERIQNITPCHSVKLSRQGQPNSKLSVRTAVLCGFYS